MIGLVGLKTSLALNAAIFAVYTIIIVLSMRLGDHLWTMVAGFMVWAVAIRCMTFYWMMRRVQEAFPIIAITLVQGLIWTAIVAAASWALERFWPIGAEFILIGVSAWVAIRSSFPVLNRSGMPKHGLDDE